jgi:hypothetical protein
MDLTYLYGCEHWGFLLNEKYRRLQKNKMIREQSETKQE